MRGISILIAGLAALALMLVLLLRPPQRAGDAPHWTRTDYSALDGWPSDAQGQALAAFLRSCARWSDASDTKALGVYGTVRDWRGVCQAAQGVPAGDDAAARRFFETAFVPLAVAAGHAREGLFTGYYTPVLDGSLTRSERFRVPLLARPDDLVMVDLGRFRPELRGQRIAGRVKDGDLVPYADRAALEAEMQSGARARPAVLWLEDPVDAFFLHIQGSGQIRLRDGTLVRVGYDGQNGFPYTPIGRVLRARGAIEKGKVSMQTIRAWLQSHPGEAQAMMNTNASYVFFRLLTVEDAALGPPGAQGAPVTPGRSLAVDDAIHAYGVPMWIEAAPPAPDLQPAPPDARAPLRRLMIAQDTGGAILGAVRGDVYWGMGDAAGALAGKMASKGTMTVLVPPAVAAKLLDTR